MAYAYPRVSVFDDYNGWDGIDHMDRVEFYSDFNDYRVAVKVPKNYVYGAPATFSTLRRYCSRPLQSACSNPILRMK